MCYFLKINQNILIELIILINIIIFYCINLLISLIFIYINKMKENINSYN